MIPDLSYIKTNSVIKQYETEGHSPFLVLGDDFKSYVLKYPKNQFDKYSIIKEFLCHYFLLCWSIPTPHAVAISIPNDVLDSELIPKRVRPFIENTDCFGSELIKNPVEMQDFIVAANKTSLRQIKNPSTIFDIAIFDIWIENDDRKPSNNNILLCPADKGLYLYAIDNAYTFATLKFEELNNSSVSFSDNDSILYSPLANSIINQSKINQEWMSIAKEKFYLCIQLVEKYFPDIIKNIPASLDFSNSDASTLSNFLFNKERNKQVFEQFCYIVNLISK